MNKWLLYFCVLASLPAHLCCLVEKTKEQLLAEKAKEEQRIKDEQEKQKQEEKTRELHETEQMRQERKEQEEVLSEFKTAVDNLNTSVKAFSDAQAALIGVTEGNVATVLQKLEKTRKTVADTQKTYDTAKQTASKLGLKTAEPEKPGQMAATDIEAFAKNMAKSPDVFAQVLASDYARELVTANAQQNPELWLTALTKARDEKLSAADQRSVEKLQSAAIDAITKRMLESADKNKAGIMQNALIQFLELTKSSPSQRANQIKIIESFSKKGFTDATALATAMVVSRFTLTLDFKPLDTNQRAILMDAATKMMQKGTEPQQFYGLAMMNQMIGRGKFSEIPQATVEPLVNTVKKAFQQKVSFLNEKKEKNMMGDTFMDTIVKTNMLQQLLPIAAAYTTDVKKLNTWITSFDQQITTKTAEMLVPHYDLIINEALGNNAINTANNKSIISQWVNNFAKKAKNIMRTPDYQTTMQDFNNFRPHSTEQQKKDAEEAEYLKLLYQPIL